MLEVYPKSEGGQIMDIFERSIKPIDSRLKQFDRTIQITI